MQPGSQVNMSSMKDVAKLAGVSVATVSRVVNQAALVDEHTRHKVNEAIKKLHYRPNLLARRLRQQHVQSRSGKYGIYEKYREYAQREELYPGGPGRGKRMGFAAIFGIQPFCIEVEQSVLKQAALAGFDRRDIFVLDNQYDPDVGLQNAEIILSQRPDIFIEYQADIKINNIVAARFLEAGIPLIAVDVPVPGAPFVGVNNWQVATMGGKYMAKLLMERWGGWHAVDLVILLQCPTGGEVNMLRSEGFATALVEIFGEQVEAKIVRKDGGIGRMEQGRAAMIEILTAYPEARKIAVTTLNEEMMEGVIFALKETGRWQRDNLIVITTGVDDLGKTQIREGLSDAGVAFFPEKYGEYIIPAVCAILEDAPVPSHMYVENTIITKENIAQFYPLD